MLGKPIDSIGIADISIGNLSQGGQTVPFEQAFTGVLNGGPANFTFKFCSVHGDAGGDFFGPSTPGPSSVAVNVPSASNASVTIFLWYVTGGTGPPRDPSRCGITAFDFATGEELPFVATASVVPASAQQNTTIFTNGPLLPNGVNEVQVELAHTHGAPPIFFRRCMSLSTNQNIGRTFTLARGHSEDFLVGYTATDPCQKIKDAIGDLQEKILAITEAIAEGLIKRADLPAVEAKRAKLRTQMAKLQTQLKACEDGK